MNLDALTLAEMQNMTLLALWKIVPIFHPELQLVHLEQIQRIKILEWIDAARDCESRAVMANGR